MFDSLKLGDTDNLTKREIAEKVARLKLPMVLVMLAKIIIPIMGVAIWSLPTLAVIYLVTFVTRYFQPSFLRNVALSGSVILFFFAFVLVAGILSQLGQPGIIAGKFPRKVEHPIYALRRIYGLCWTQVFYFKPLYSFFLAFPITKHFLFRLFGYKGSTDFTVYPDCWIRDLPQLSIGENSYLANRSTIGTNICLNDGSIIVGPITLEKQAMVGHMAVFGLGTTLGEKAELGVGVSMGIRITIGKEVLVKPKANINHGAKIGDNSTIGSCALIGLKSTIGPQINIKDGASIPPGANVRTQKEADSYFSSEKQSLTNHSDAILRMMEKFVQHEGATTEGGA